MRRLRRRRSGAPAGGGGFANRHTAARIFRVLKGPGTLRDSRATRGGCRKCGSGSVIHGQAAAYVVVVVGGGGGAVAAAAADDDDGGCGGSMVGVLS